MTIVVMDGVGIGDGKEGDAVAQARTPTLDWLRGLRSSQSLLAHGKAVGMPTNEDMGNSEVGHNAMGCGRVYDQGALLVNRAIERASIELCKLAFQREVLGRFDLERHSVRAQRRDRSWTTT